MLKTPSPLVDGVSLGFSFFPLPSSIPASRHGVSCCIQTPKLALMGKTFPGLSAAGDLGGAGERGGGCSSRSGQGRQLRRLGCEVLGSWSLFLHALGEKKMFVSSLFKYPFENIQLRTESWWKTGLLVNVFPLFPF